MKAKKKEKKAIDTTLVSGGAKTINSLEEGTNKDNNLFKGPKGSAMPPR